MQLLRNIYCTGEVLHHVQLAKIFTDDKHFVDMGLLYAPAEIISKFQNMLKNHTIDRAQLIEFVNTSFAPPGTEFEEWNPQDWHKSFIPMCLVFPCANENKDDPSTMSQAALEIFVDSY
ncbi:unnamed protein product [Ranitomeya imitator]|uniref:Trehalase n=1 Tax=Ranitomeya imitator TaxID=111125 RepID=A0ABN9L7Z1_9NEOB|nr:unnamed protein product [Ranitomeya imitator]